MLMKVLSHPGHGNSKCYILGKLDWFPFLEKEMKGEKDGEESRILWVDAFCWMRVVRAATSPL